MSSYGRKLLASIAKNANTIDNNVVYNLPFNGPGSAYQTPDCQIIQIEDNIYRLIVGVNQGPLSNYSRTGLTLPQPLSMKGAAAYHHMYGTPSQEHHIDAQTVREILDGKSFPNLGLMRMTTQEKERLAELRKELEICKKQQKLNKFKELPAHIRQEIVDEAIVNDMTSKIHDVKDADFPGHQELTRLSSIKLPNGMFGNVNLTSLSASFAGYSTSIATGSKYYAIISLFTKDELINAHIEASIDDEISN